MWARHLTGRGLVLAAALGSGAGTSVFLVVLDRAIDDGSLTIAVTAGVVFAAFMAAWNGGLQYRERRRRTTRNVLFEQFVGQTVGVTIAAWVVLPVLDRIRWPDMASLTVLGAAMVAVGWLRTRRNIRGRRRDELFS
jgi:O-antigen/teichoic acid export membrane protein